MKKNQLLSIAAILLFLLGIIMVFLGVNATILPPTLTGVGFVIISIALIGLKDK